MPKNLLKATITIVKIKNRKDEGQAMGKTGIKRRKTQGQGQKGGQKQTVPDPDLCKLNCLIIIRLPHLKKG